MCQSGDGGTRLYSNQSEPDGHKSIRRVSNEATAYQPAGDNQSTLVKQPYIASGTQQISAVPGATEMKVKQNILNH